MADTGDVGASEHGQSQAALVDVSDVITYLRRIIASLLDDQSEAVNIAFKEKSVQESLKKFISDHQVPALMIQRLTLKDEAEVSTEEEKEGAVYYITTDVAYANPKVQSIVFYKRGSVIEIGKSIASQLRVSTLADGSPYDSLYSCVANVVAPYFKSYVRATGKADREGDKMIPSVEKKIAELETGLLHLLQNIEIPDITLPVHPVVAALIKKSAEEGVKPKATEVGDKVEDATFLNALQGGVNRWVREIQKVTKLDRDPSSGTAMQEISFWLNLERALLRIQEKRESPEVTLTLEILKHGKRFHATVSFDADTGLQAALTLVNDYNQLMKDFPLNDLLTATELPKIRAAVLAIFNHLKNIRKTKYPLTRTLRLIEAISRDLHNQLSKVLGPRRLMHTIFDEFEKVMAACMEVFACWDDEYDKLQNLLRDAQKKQKSSEMKMVLRINPSHKKLQGRVEHMIKFRRQHEQLRQVIVRVLRPVAALPSTEESGSSSATEVHAIDAADAGAIDEVNQAYEVVKEVDCLEVSKEGNDAWESAVKRYDERIDRIEAQITVKLRDQLAAARNANEMFRIFSRFNALFYRPHIRGAIREYQTQLIQRVKDDIGSLHEKFKQGYPQSKTCRMSHIRDLPPVSGSIIWAKQIERQLNAYLRRVEDVLGKSWEQHVEGAKLKQDGESFRLKLNTNELFEHWVQKVQQQQINVSGRIFNIESMRSRVPGRGNILKLRVNFLPEIITIAKEVRNLKHIGYRVPLPIVNKAHAAVQYYPHAVSLIESIRTYDRSMERIEDKRGVLTLMAGMRKELQNLIAEGMGTQWESYKVEVYVQKFAETVSSFGEKVDELLEAMQQIETLVGELDNCAYVYATFREILTKLQKHVDDLSLHQYSNLPHWVQQLDEDIEQKLSVRLDAGLRAWISALYGNSETKLEESDDTKEVITVKLGGEPKLKEFVMELRMTSQLMFVHPSLEASRCFLYSELFSWESVITKLPRLQHSRYQVGVGTNLDSSQRSDLTYQRVLTQLPKNNEAVSLAYGEMENILETLSGYVKDWFTYQSLWDLQPETLYSQLGTNLAVWMKTLEDIKASRQTYDTSETNKNFGPIRLEFGKVQSKVSLKYDSWHKDVLGKFGNMLGNEMQDFYGTVGKCRTDLEQQSVDAANTGDAVTAITYVQALKRKMKVWDKQVKLYKDGQRILERQRFQFPNNWLYSDNVEGEWGAFNDILKRKETSIQSQLASLQMKVVAEDKLVEAKTTDILGEWEREKPVEGTLRPDIAAKSLSIFEGKFQRLREERDNMAKAKEALELAEPGSVSAMEERVQVAMEEMQDLKSVWHELSTVWTEIDDMKEKPWQTVQPRKLRQQLDGQMSHLKELPARIRQYASYEHVKKTLQAYAKVNMLVTELKSEAVRDRHWKQLMKRLHVNWTLAELTLGQLWDIDLQKNETIVRDVLATAQGEMALEEFLKQVAEVWKSYMLDLINYQNKCRIIRGWDDLFNKVKEHINSVSAMKLSPYYKTFEEEAVAWEDRLNKISGLFDVWIDVQRRWVYLDGIFSNSADIKQLLPVETSRFQNVSTEYLALMKKVAKSPLVLDVLNIPNGQKQLERLADLLTKIQKALGDYLEKERASFPRFYFVGDEDLLEIIGNSRNIARLQKHFRKMFAGVYSLIIDDDHSQIIGVASKEGEEVRFKTPLLMKDRRINDWLTLVDQEVRVTLASLLAQAVHDAIEFRNLPINGENFLAWVDRYQAQLVVLAAQIVWSEGVERALTTVEQSSGNNHAPLVESLQLVESTLNVLADSVLHEQPPVRRKKLEHLITELVHQRDITRTLVKNKVTGPKSFEWLSQMRFYFDAKIPDVLQQLTIYMANAKFHYGFEYLGVQEKLVQTPLTDRCYLTMTQALESRLGGSPFGPAGTGKTESVKALGNQLGRFVLVFNCDETFDFQAMGRIFVGLCQVGAWGCFDEFNRLEERMLSAVSQQVQTIQEALKEHAESSETGSNIVVELVDKQVRVHQDMAIFITMNPDYAGRSNLPDNLKKLFRSLAMTQPDRQMIAQVMLYSQGFRMAEKLASKIVPFFKLCDEQLSPQSHYDFGLRALKSVLVSAGNVKRDRIQSVKEQLTARGEPVDEATISEQLPEQEILIQSVMETVVPKLVAEDIPLLNSLLSDVFPGVEYTPAAMARLRSEIQKVCVDMFLTYGEKDEQGTQWVGKVLQLFQISQIHHGLMMVGPSGSGKSAAWRVLLKALERLEGVEGVAHVIDPKSISKEALYGSMDPNTREWTDGLFTHVLRKIVDNVRGEIHKRQWIVFDGDVDPEWVENLNSVLDDNKLLTLPNGERLAIPPNVRIMFEVQDLRYATLATVSRCGMVWFSEDVLSIDMIFDNYLQRLRNVPIEETEEEMTLRSRASKSVVKDEDISPMLQVQRDCAAVLQPFFGSDGLVVKVLQYALTLEHVMDFTRLRALGTLFSMLNQSVRTILTYNHNHSDFPIQINQLEKYITKCLVYSLLWSMAGDGKLKVRKELGDFLRSVTTIPLPAQNNAAIMDFEVAISGEWLPWSQKVPVIEVETHKVAAPDVVIPTIDTVRHESLLYTWLAEHKPMVLCGPPGSGKTMTLFSALRALPDLEVVGLNFSSATTPELLLKTFDHYCEYRKTPNGMVLAPIQLNKWLVLFCDEINLPELDKYGTQRVISFLRQIVEHGGFYRTTDQSWVKFERIQFVGACNPPTDPGRKPLSHRFLRHVPVVYVDYPGKQSLIQIYGTFNRAMLRLIPSLRAYAEPLTNAMTEFYLMSQEKFTQDMQPHYIYSPREMTRWVRGICEALRPLETLPTEGLVRIWAHEALRLFHDRLVDDEEREWTIKNIDTVALKHFPNVDKISALKRPILYSNWMSKDYVPVEQETLRDYVKARLKVFYEEELDVPMVLFDEVLDHVLRIDRIFRQPQGHLLLIGVSGAGKTTLSRFVAWMNGLSVFQVKVHNKYTAVDFDEDLRSVLRRAGCRGEKICFIMDESNVLDASFLERMNTLLANGEVPGLFEGDELTTLMTQCKEGAAREGHMLDTQEELYKWFTQQVIYNLHVVFTMNPSSEGLKSRAATSPALFNRCVLNWFGDWSNGALYQVGRQLTSKVDLDKSNYVAPSNLPVAYEGLPASPSHRDVVSNAFVFIHQTAHQINERLVKRGAHTTSITPRHFLDCINHMVKLYHEKRADLEEQQLHLNKGLFKLRETVEQVEELQKSLSIKRNELEEKNNAANAKLKQMVKDQQEAERRKVMSQEIQASLEVQTAIIAEKQTSVRDDLAKVEPAVVEAQQAVKGIKKQHLVEVKSLTSPPASVKLALESICLLLGESTADFKSIRSIIVRDNFISTIVNFNTEFISEEIRQKMQVYLENPEYNFDRVNRASQACGPLVKWAIAQVNFWDVLNRVEPLRNELKSLELEAAENRTKAEQVLQVITELEHSIARYKEEYAMLISQAQAIKSDLSAVEAKVERSVALLKSLGNERKRWEAGSETFKSQMATIIGDVLLSSAFMAYAGYYDQHMRQNLFTTWTSHLLQANIQFKPDLARIEYLSNADERMRWQHNSLPSDDLCLENAIMLRRFNRYPLIIDPSGQATEFLLNEFRDKKISKTSFLDDAFRKNLESALRFGNPLLIQDVESYDPIMNPVLNRELRRTGGRVLISLGDQDIDLSPSFTVFMSTRDPTVDFAPDLCSRVTFVNFTVTRSSLQSQCLNQVLKSERPDVDAKRSDLLKLQGEFMLRLRHLEKSLLSALNEVKGRILDDDSIITHLETLKREAGEIAHKVEETDVVMAEVERVSQQYIPLAQSCSSIYFTLEALNQVHFLYQFSLQFFLDIFAAVLYNNTNLEKVTEYDKRLAIVTSDLFNVTYRRVSRGMLHQDRVTFACLLARIHLKQCAAESTYDAEFNFLLRGDEGRLKEAGLVKVDGLTPQQAEAAVKLSKFTAFNNLMKNIQTSEVFKNWLQADGAEHSVPAVWETSKPLTKIGEAIHRLLLVQAFRPDRLLAAMHLFVDETLGSSFMKDIELVVSLPAIIEHEVKASTPILMCSVPGFDASSHVDDLATELNKQITSIAIGSAEGFVLAEKAVNSASKSGRWVQLKNVHLAPQWLVQLEKKLHSITPHAGFRLFLTMEINPKLPVNLLRAGRIFVFEPPPGVKSNLLRTINTIPVQRMCKIPNERSRIYFLLAWFHAIVQERLRYAPLGWSKRYEFNESDLRCACDTIDIWIDMVAMGRTNLPPEKVPWDAIRTLLAQCIYGGKIDNEFDQRLLSAFLLKLFTKSNFSADFVLVAGREAKGSDIVMPDGTRREQFLQWVESLPIQQTPSWLGLPNNAEKVLLTTRGCDMISKLLKMQLLEDDEELAYKASASSDKVKKEADGRPAWMRVVMNSMTTWLDMLPKILSGMRRTAENIKDPLFRFFEREVNVGIKLLNDIRCDLNELMLICRGEKKPTNHHRGLMSDLAKGIIPQTWKRYTVPQGLTVIQWITDFSERIKQLQAVVQAAQSGGTSALKNLHVWLGGLFIAEAYITATRQYVAQANSWSLEELYLEVKVFNSEAAVNLDDCSFGITGLKVQGAVCKNNVLELSSTISTDLPLTCIRWIRVDSVKQSASRVTLPVYLNATRGQNLFTVEFETQGDGSGKDHCFYERGVALIGSTLGS